MTSYSYMDENGTFSINKPENISYLYFPLASEAGLKSSITPNLGGDIKTDQETFLLEPVSSENLHNNRSSRNFWCRTQNNHVYSATGNSSEQDAVKFTSKQDDSVLQAGFMWQTLTRTSSTCSLRSSITNFVPVHENVEIMYVTIENLSSEKQTIDCFSAIPIYGRSADNIRDHRNVTSMLHRIDTTENGIYVCPTMSFDERGHRRNHTIYYVLGCTGESELPLSFYPTVEQFIGEGGNFTHPRSIYENAAGAEANSHFEGQEAMGAIRFHQRTLSPGETTNYIILMGIHTDKEAISTIYKKYNSSEKVLSALESVKCYWNTKVNVSFQTSDKNFDMLMKWICFQPFLRRLFGCSFLPHHDYGRGGRGWRDLWQDCLSLLLMDPNDVGRMIAVNYGGVRIDGTNATIIGSGEGEFIADRNGIARVWMDHALWPFMTTQLYIDQTGDIDILSKEAPYFKDAQSMRGTQTDSFWNDSYGNLQKTESDIVYQGSILEHLLIQHLTGFYEVGKHNIFQLRGADWNDALDMASEHGESVAFTCAYAGNLLNLSSLIQNYKDKQGIHQMSFLREIDILLHNDLSDFTDVHKKAEILASYNAACCHNISGEKITYDLSELADFLKQKAEQLISYLREHEWISISDKEGWYNSYYDNSENSVDGIHNGQIRMMLTGQVFSIMSHVATPSQIKKISESADHYLYKKEIGGYRLNTDFKELKFDMGRMFGFAYGEKENGAVFSHMTVMYANALYKRGFAKEGWKALSSLADQSLNFEISRIFPGIPEYFRSDGRGMYHYLTGAASWFMMTMITEVFGVHGYLGDLVFQPKLLAEQFNEQNLASIHLTFAGKKFHVTYLNPEKKEFGEYQITDIICDGKSLLITDNTNAVLTRDVLNTLNDNTHEIVITLK